MAAPQKPFGFTLIELMITIAVLVILVTLAAPAFNLAEQRRLVGAAESALDQVQTARTEAIKQGRDIYFVSEGDGANWCHGISDTSGCSCTQTDPDEADACAIVIADDGERVLRAATHNSFRNISMDGSQEIRISHVRGTVVAGTPTRLEFESAPSGFEMHLELNAIGRPRLCGQGRSFGGYAQCN
ncbi:GspH/FimT family pseudopilin [Roseovarius sp.]|uniref:GspH/FimT family pseudopilin n=1 Tax=Roseovarius sp. TaxID=1486281 RepID=UPI003568EA6B